MLDKVFTGVAVVSIVLIWIFSGKYVHWFIHGKDDLSDVTTIGLSFIGSAFMLFIVSILLAIFAKSLETKLFGIVYAVAYIVIILRLRAKHRKKDEV